MLKLKWVKSLSMDKSELEKDILSRIYVHKESINTKQAMIANLLNSEEDKKELGIAGLQGEIYMHDQMVEELLDILSKNKG